MWAPQAFAVSCTARHPSCDPNNALANTQNILCFGSSTCTAAPSGKVTVKENLNIVIGATFDFTKAQCQFDLGGRALEIQKTLQVPGGSGIMKFFNVGDVTLGANAKLKARGDYVEPQGFVITGGTISIVSKGVITLVKSGAIIDVLGDGAGTIHLEAAGANASGIGIDLQSDSGLLGIGHTDTADAGMRFTDGGFIELIATTGAITDAATITLTGTNQGGGGEIDMTAARTIAITQSIDATGGGGDGGTIDFEAGDTITVAKTLDVSSTVGGGFGGSLLLVGGDDTLGIPGGLVGGGVTLDMTNNAQLKANGSDAETSGGDGGDIELDASGLIQFTHPGNSPAMQASGGPLFDGSGGSVTFDAGDDDPNRIGPLDGDVVLNGDILVNGGGGGGGGASGGDGGSFDASAGKTLTINSSITLTGDTSGGDISTDSGGTTSVNGVIDVHGTGPTADAGTVDLESGFALGGVQGALTVTKNVIATAGANNSSFGSIFFTGCTLTVNGSVKVDGTGGTSLACAGGTRNGLACSVASDCPSGACVNHNGGSAIELAAVGTMQLLSGSQYLAPPGGSIRLTHPPGQIPQKTGAIFNPAATDHPEALGSGAYSNCPVCGDGIRQPGEACDKGAGADGACCNANCSAFVCPTPTPTVTPTSTHTAIPTSTPTSTLTATSTPVPATTPTFTVAPTPTVMMTVAATATSTATPTQMLTPSATFTGIPTSTLTATRTATLTPTATSTSISTAALTPTTTSTSISTATLTPAPIPTATLTGAPTPTVTLTTTGTTTSTSTSTQMLTPSATLTGIPTSTPTATLTPTATSTSISTATLTPASTPTATLTGAPTPTVTLTTTGTTTSTPTPIASGSATPTILATPIGPGTLHRFQCYAVQHGSPKGPDVNLTDEFGASMATVTEPKRICNPADENDQDSTALSDPAHLVAYRLTDTNPRFQRVRHQVVENQFGSITVDLVRPDMLLVPSAKNLSAPPPPLVSNALDHFECYRTQGGRARVDDVKINDEFGTIIVDVKRPARLCAPVDKNGEGILDPTEHLMCYEVRLTSASVFTPAGQVFINNQFGADSFQGFRPRELCVPSSVNPGAF